jgi:hypothetical protein
MALELTGADPAAGSRIETLTLADAAGVRVPPSWRVEDCRSIRTAHGSIDLAAGGTGNRVRG